MSFFENTRKPMGLGGKIMVAMMNLGHSPVARWGLCFLELTLDAKVLDCGCGGGANIKRLLKKCPEGIVKGIDYSPVSVEKSKKVNEAAIARRVCTVLQGSVGGYDLFADDWFDAVTAFEKPFISGPICRSALPGGLLRWGPAGHYSSATKATAIRTRTRSDGDHRRMTITRTPS